MTNATIKFDSAKTTKPATFGRGIHRSLPTFKAVVSEADERAAAQMFADDRAFDAALDRLAAESAAQDRLDAGLDCY